MAFSLPRIQATVSPPGWNSLFFSATPSSQSSSSSSHARPLCVRIVLAADLVSANVQLNSVELGSMQLCVPVDGFCDTTIGLSRWEVTIHTGAAVITFAYRITSTCSS